MGGGGRRERKLDGDREDEKVPRPRGARLPLVRRDFEFRVHDRQASGVIRGSVHLRGPVPACGGHLQRSPAPGLGGPGSTVGPFGATWAGAPTAFRPAGAARRGLGPRVGAPFAPWWQDGVPRGTCCPAASPPRAVSHAALSSCPRHRCFYLDCSLPSPFFGAPLYHPGF